MSCVSLEKLCQCETITRPVTSSQSETTHSGSRAGAAHDGYLALTQKNTVQQLVYKKYIAILYKQGVWVGFILDAKKKKDRRSEMAINFLCALHCGKTVGTNNICSKSAYSHQCMWHTHLPDKEGLMKSQFYLLMILYGSAIQNDWCKLSISF